MGRFSQGKSGERTSQVEESSWVRPACRRGLSYSKSLAPDAGTSLGENIYHIILAASLFPLLDCELLWAGILPFLISSFDTHWECILFPSGS